MRNQTQSSYMRIRHYVFDWLASREGSVTRLPSNRELAEKFGVSQPTVVRALQELVREGYLTNRRGVGLFSNPDRIGTRESRIVLPETRRKQRGRADNAFYLGIGIPIRAVSGRFRPAARSSGSSAICRS